MAKRRIVINERFLVLVILGLVALLLGMEVLEKFIGSIRELLVQIGLPADVAGSLTSILFFGLLLYLLWRVAEMVLD